MTLALDTTALLARYLDGPTRPVILDAMSADHDWCASAMALTEALMLVDRLGDGFALVELALVGRQNQRAASTSILKLCLSSPACAHGHAALAAPAAASVIRDQRARR